MPFPCIKHIYFTFKERPDINFDLISLGVIGKSELPCWTTLSNYSSKLVIYGGSVEFLQSIIITKYNYAIVQNWKPVQM